MDDNTQPAPDAVEAALDKLEKILSDLGLPATEQEAVPAARAAYAALLARAEAQRVALEAGDKVDDAIRAYVYVAPSSFPDKEGVLHNLAEALAAYRAARAKGA